MSRSGLLLGIGPGGGGVLPCGFRSWQFAAGLIETQGFDQVWNLQGGNRTPGSVEGIARGRRLLNPHQPALPTCSFATGEQYESHDLHKTQRLFAISKARAGFIRAKLLIKGT